MKRLIAIVIAVVGAAMAAAAESDSPDELGKSPLMAAGELQRVREALAPIYQFAIEPPHLKIDRAGWDRAAKDTAKQGARDDNLPAANLPNMNLPIPNVLGGPPMRANRFAQNREPGSAIETLFQQLQERAQIGSRSISSGFGGSSRDRERHFSGDSLSGRLHMRGESVRVFLEEALHPQRTLELSTDSETVFRLQIAHPDGDFILLHQARNGAFSAIVVLGTQMFSGRGESFIAFFKQNGQWMEATGLPVLEKFGIFPILSPNSATVRNVVLVSLLGAPAAHADPQQLLANLDSDAFEVREKASKLLSGRYELYKDAIQQKLEDKLISAEVRVRLQRIVAEQSVTRLATQTVAALGLADDPNYIVSLLDDAESNEIPTIVRHLEKITGQNLGADAAAWKEWSKNNRSKNDSQTKSDLGKQ